MTARLPRLLIASCGSGGGKTTLACGLLQLWREDGRRPGAWKVGPDYIDPLFHRQVTGTAAGNLDLFFTGEETARSLLAKGAEECGAAVLEGVMGFYDGVACTDRGSSYQVAKATETPVILLVDARGAALSLAALVRGFVEFRPGANIRGVVLGRCSRTLHSLLAPAIETHSGVPVLGFLPEDRDYAVESRHLGLVAPGEIEDLRSRMKKLAGVLRSTLELGRLWEIALSAPDLAAAPYACSPVTELGPRLALAEDEAFCFYYQENLRMLEEMGAELVRFSPLHDRTLPPDIHGIYLGGGYPELHARALAENARMRAGIKEAAGREMPLVAECGGFLYLQESLEDPDGRVFPMAGVLEGHSRRENGLRQFGYATLSAQEDNLYCGCGESVPAHEFHYWHSTNPGGTFFARKPERKSGWPCMVARGNLIAGFPHLYYPAKPAFAANFVRAAAAFKERST